METTLTLQQPTIETTEKILVHQDQLTERIRQEAELRARLLNDIISHGIVKNSEVKQITISEKTIENFIFSEQLKVNKFMAQQHEAGKRMIFGEYRLPDNLEHLMDSLLAWSRYPVSRNTDKFQFLFYTDRWAVNEPELESFFEKMKYKSYTQGDVIKEVTRLHDFCGYLEEEGAEPHQILSIAFWNLRLTCDSAQACNRLPKKKFMIKLSWLTRER